MKIKRTERGFEIINFHDAFGDECSLQQSSAIGDTDHGLEFPGSSYIWFGKKSNRMHLSEKQIKELIPLLENWVKTGSFSNGVI